MNYLTLPSFFQNFIIQLVKFQIGMSKEKRLQERLRVSGSVYQKDVYKEFMVYAKEVRDELQVYEYMQEHEIGIDEWQYWLNRFEIIRTRCQFVQLVKLINKLKKNQQAIQPQSIAKYERKIIEKMQKMYFRHLKGKRTARQFNNQVYGLHPSTRKIGNINIYVDQTCRSNYMAEDLALWIETHMQEECQLERNSYEQYQERKHPSFIAKNEQNLLELTKQLYARHSRKSLGDKNSLGSYRLSNNINLLENNKFEAVDYNTPKNQDQNKSNIDMPKHQQHKKNLKTSSKRVERGRDSLQILKSMQKKKKQNGVARKSPKFKSPSFKSSFDQQFKDLDGVYDISVSHQQKCRSVITKEQHLFSFGKSKSEKKNNISKTVDALKDNAFMLHSFSQECQLFDKTNTNFVQKQDFMLELMIKEIQRQAYEVTQIKTFASQIGSNEENQIYSHEFIDHCRDIQQRKPFEVLIQTENEENKQFQTAQLQKLIDFDQDKSSSQSSGQYMNSVQDPERMSINNRFCTFLSENKKRLSNISEQSNFQSQSKRKNNFYQ